MIAVHINNAGELLDKNTIQGASSLGNLFGLTSPLVEAKIADTLQSELAKQGVDATVEVVPEIAGVEAGASSAIAFVVGAGLGGIGGYLISRS